MLFSNRGLNLSNFSQIWIFIHKIWDFSFNVFLLHPRGTAPSPGHCHSGEARNLEPNAETDIKNRKNITERKNHISKQKSLAAGYCLKRDVAVPWPKKPGIWER